MKQRIKVFTASIYYLTMALLLSSNAMAQSDSLAGAKYDVVDRFGVNVASGQVQMTQTPLSIGGAMGLNHTISSLTSDFVNLTNHGGTSPSIWGFGDENRGGLYSVVLYRCSPPPNDNDCRNPSHSSPDSYYGLRAFGGGAQGDFQYGSSGDWLPYNRPSSSSLEFVDTTEFTGYVMTTGDGTKRYYPGTELIPTGNYGYVGIVRRSMSKVVHPNGFTVEISTTNGIDGSLYSVRTNTGFQLKYDFTGSWTVSSPTKVTALNNAIERCPHSSASCTPGSTWPFSTYTWPVNEPDPLNTASLEDPSVFRVQDAEGRVTDYHHEPHDPVNSNVHPRISQIKKDGDVVMNYTHAINSQNLIFYHSQPFIAPFQIARPVSASVSGGGSQTYGLHLPRYYYTLIGYENTAGSGFGKINLVQTTEYGAMEKIESWDQIVNFYHDFVDDTAENVKYVENYVTAVDQKAGNITTAYAYDARGNVTQRSIGGNTWSAGYPSACNSSNFRFCNKPEWIKDPLGNQTDFEYHTASGQISLRESPAGTNGIRPKTYYEYAEYYAHYKIDSETIEAADSPVWLLSQETHCQNGNMSSTGTCYSGDAVVTAYEYDYHNLFLIGVAVTAKNAQGVLETRRTCYEYDVYGNRIGETSPRANLASCQ